MSFIDTCGCVEKPPPLSRKADFWAPESRGGLFNATASPSVFQNAAGVFQNAGAELSSKGAKITQKGFGNLKSLRENNDSGTKGDEKHTQNTGSLKNL